MTEQLLSDPARAVVECAIAWREQWKSGSGNAAAVQLADAVERMQASRVDVGLVRAERVSGVRVEAGPASPLVSPGPRPVGQVSEELRDHAITDAAAGIDGGEWSLDPAEGPSARAVATKAVDELIRQGYLTGSPSAAWPGDAGPVAAEIAAVRDQVPPAGLPATLSSVDDVRRVCEAAGLIDQRYAATETSRTWTSADGEVRIRAVFNGRHLYCVSPVGTPFGVDIFRDTPSAVLWHAIQAARSAS